MEALRYSDYLSPFSFSIFFIGFSLDIVVVKIINCELTSAKFSGSFNPTQPRPTPSFCF